MTPYLYLFSLTVPTLKKRSPRKNSSYPVTCSLQNSTTGEILPGSVSATLCNVSSTGVCIIVRRMIIDGNHLFFTTLNSEQYNLVLRPNNYEDDTSKILTAQPIWMDSCIHDGYPAFKVGIKLGD